MKSKEPLINIIEEVTLKMDCQIIILAVTNPAVNEYAVRVCDVKWAQAGLSVTIGGVSYKITSVDYSKNILFVTGASAITAKKFLLYRPYFFSGTPIDTGTDLSKIPSLYNKTPMVWLMETFSEEFNENEEDEEERKSAIRLFFLTQADLTQRPEILNRDYVQCMTRLKDAFIEALEACFGRFNTNDLKYKTTYYPKFGVYISEKGVQQKLWADNLSGCEIDPDLLLYKIHSCCGAVDTFYFANEEETFIFTDENGVPFTSEI